MAKKKQQEDYKELSEEALQDRIAEMEISLKKIKLSHAINPVENPMVIRETRRQIARLKAELHARALQANNSTN